LPEALFFVSLTLLAGCWQQEYLQFQFGGAPVSQQTLIRNPCSDPQFAALASGIIKVVHFLIHHNLIDLNFSFLPALQMSPYDFSFEGREASAYEHPTFLQFSFFRRLT
jgi:hypothetical protein